MLKFEIHSWNLQFHLVLKRSLVYSKRDFVSHSTQEVALETIFGILINASITLDGTDTDYMKFYCQWILVSENTVVQFHTSHSLRGLIVGLGLSQCKHTINVCLHVTLFRPCSLLRPLKFSIEDMVSVWIMGRMGDGPILSVVLITMVVMTNKGWKTLSVNRL